MQTVYSDTNGKSTSSGDGRAPIDRVLSALKANNYDPKPTGSGEYKCRCPGHDGEGDSLLIKEGDDGRVLFHCFAHDCPPDAIVSPLGLGVADLFPFKIGAKPRPSGKVRKSKGPGWRTLKDAVLWVKDKDGWPEAQFFLYTLDGRPHMGVGRFNRGKEKTCRPFHFDPGSQRWQIGDPPGKLPLFNADEVAAAELVDVHEGEKCCKAVKPLGVTATTSSHGSEAALKTDWGSMAGKNVRIFPDNDEPGKSYCDSVLSILAKLDPPPTVRVVNLPLANEGDDVVEWLEQRQDQSPEETLADLNRLADAAPVVDLGAYRAQRNGRHASVGPEPSANGKAFVVRESICDPHRLARVYRGRECMHDGTLTLRYYQGEYLRWDRAYRELTGKDVRAEVTASIKAEFDHVNEIEYEQWIELGKKDADGNPCSPPVVRKVTTSLVGDALQALSGYTYLVSTAAQPGWLCSQPPFPADEVLPARNALIHLPSLVSGGDAIRPPTPEFFCSYALDYDFDMAAPEPVNWLTFLGSRPVVPGGRVRLQLWAEDPESIQALQEWMGYLLTPDTSQQKIMMLIGPRRSGKGTIGRIIKALIGAANVANPTLSSLGTNFGLAPLIGKPAAIITDARLSGRADIAQTLERLLSVSGEDAQTIDRKHLPAWSGTLPTRFMMFTNETPRLPDASGALAGRMVMLALPRSFYGVEDKALTRLLLKELPGILLWAIEGWNRLRERGRFTQPKSGTPLVEEMEALSSPIGEFLRECCAIVPHESIPVADLFTSWKFWCEAQGNEKHKGTKAGFGRDLRTVFPSLKTKVVRRNSKLERDFVGLRIRVNGDPEPEGVEDEAFDGVEKQPH